MARAWRTWYWAACVVGLGMAAEWIASMGAEVPSKESSSPEQSEAAPAKPFDAEFVDPQAAAQRFVSELNRLLKAEKLPTPAEIFEQAAKASSFPVEVLPDPGQKLSPETIYARAKPAVVILGALPPRKGKRQPQGAFATGFVVHKDGIVVTNYHVLEVFQNMRAIGVMTHDGRVLPIRAGLAGDAHSDVALVKVDAKDLTPLPVARSVPIGAPVYCLSHPVLTPEETENAFFTFTPGLVMGKYRLQLYGHTHVDVLALSTDYAKGSSGAPILNEHGAVVGIACETRSITYEAEVTEVQMTWKLSRPISGLLALIQPRPADRSQAKGP